MNTTTTVTMSVNDHYRILQDLFDAHQEEVAWLHEEIAEWKRMYIELIRSSPDPG